MLENIFFILAAVAGLCGFLAIGMTFYLGRSKGKEIDLLVHGREIAADGIFYQILRLPTYGAAFASKWSAKRSHLLHIRDQFDKEFQLPFIITHYLFMVGAIFFILAVILDEFFLHIT